MATDQDLSVALPTDTESAIKTLDDGSVEVDLDAADYDGSEILEAEYKTGHFENLVPQLDHDELLEISKYVIDQTEDAKQSRSDWMRMIDMGLDMMGIKLEEKNQPFQGACSAHHPLLMENAVKFQSKASTELLPPSGPVEVKVLGTESVDREAQALRVKEFMNYQITEQMTEYTPDTERMLLYLALIGSGFKKTYYNAEEERPVSEFVPAHQFIVPNNACDLHRAPYYTHELYLTKHELNKMFANGFYERPDELGDPQQRELDEVEEKAGQLEGMAVYLGEADEVYTLLEMHCNLHLESIGDDDREGATEFELASPYIVTVDKNSRTVLGLRRNWKDGDENRKKLLKFTHYGFVPGFGFYHYGFLHLLGNLQLSLTSSLRSLVDAGQFSNLQGGFKLKGVRIVDNDDPIAPGEFKEVESGIQDINKAIMRLPFGEPSGVLYQMLEFLDAKGQKFADSTEQVVADSTNYGPVGTTLALLDASTKFFSAVHKRLHNAQKQELRIIAQINSETIKDDSRYNTSNPDKAVARADFDSRVDIVPVSDPNISSNAHRIAKAQTIYEIAIKSPDQHDMREVLKHVYTNMDYDNVEKILPPPEQAQPNDPLTDIQLATQGKPIKAFEGQEHAAHIQLKSAFIKDPFSGGTPSMASTRNVLEANIQEHMFLQFSEQVKAASEEGSGEQAAAQAAQQIAQMNLDKAEQQAQQAAEGDKTDEAALLLAEAEMISAQNDVKQAEFTRELDVAKMELEKEKLELEKLKEIGKMVLADTKLAGEIEKIVVTKGLDAQIEALKGAAESANKEKEMAAKAEIDKTLKAVEPKTQDKPKEKPTSKK